MYYVYILRCQDQSLYTGITNNLKRRMTQHFTHHPLAAKYTLSHPVNTIEAIWIVENRSIASKIEYRLKKLSKVKKEQLIITKDLSHYFPDYSIQVFKGEIKIDDTNVIYFI